MNIELTDVAEHGTDHILCALTVTDDEGNTHRVAHLIPREAAEWRVAEYDLDPEDQETIIDVLLYEPHVHANGDVAPEDMPHLAPTRAHAREALLSAVGARKGPKKKLSAKAAKADPETQARAKLMGLFHMDHDVVVKKREYVDLVRDDLRLGRSVDPQARSADTRPAPPSQPDRLATITKILQMKKGGPDAADTNH